MRRYRLPFAARWKAGAATPTQPGFFNETHQLSRRHHLGLRPRGSSSRATIGRKAAQTSLDDIAEEHGPAAADGNVRTEILARRTGSSVALSEAINGRGSFGRGRPPAQIIGAGGETREPAAGASLKRDVCEMIERTYASMSRLFTHVGHRLPTRLDCPFRPTGYAFSKTGQGYEPQSRSGCGRMVKSYRHHIIDHSQ